MIRDHARPALSGKSAALFLGLVALAIPAAPARAGWVASVGQAFANIDEWRLDHTPENFTGPRPGRDFTMLAVRNNTNTPIYVAASWIPFQNPYDNSSRLSSTNNSPFIHEAWYTVQPGQVVHIGNTTNGVFYVHGVSADRSREWGGPHRFRFPNAQGELPCAQYMFAFLPREYTVDLNP